MKRNNYLNFILTLIAICLVIIVLQNSNIISTAIANENEILDHITVPVNPDGVINVNIKSFSESMDVNIKEVGGNFVRKGLPIIPETHTLNVNIEELGGYRIYNRLPVETN